MEHCGTNLPSSRTFRYMNWLFVFLIISMLKFITSKISSKLLLKLPIASLNKIVYVQIAHSNALNSFMNKRDLWLKYNLLLIILHSLHRLLQKPRDFRYLWKARLCDNNLQQYESYYIICLRCQVINILRLYTIQDQQLPRICYRAKIIVSIFGQQLVSLANIILLKYYNFYNIHISKPF